MNLADAYDSNDWQDLLNRARRAERNYYTLADQILRDHDEKHAGNARWCSSRACRMAYDRSQD
ncbi:hypothetical protein [Krasilnikovia sp. MM14-A1259]|uniref:hypothetical protein n=1 Tax=Krasilnikovia sp. MM14-A1259 TaxID=3373539 RepID=UPI00399C61DA